MNDIYAERAMQNGIDAISQACKGQRSDTINKIAYGLGRLIGASRLSEKKTADEICAAAAHLIDKTFSERELNYIVSRSLGQGKSNPNYDGQPSVDPQCHFPPADEIATFWDSCRPLNEKHSDKIYLDTIKYLRSRKFDVSRISPDIARALPSGNNIMTGGNNIVPNNTQIGTKTPSDSHKYRHFVAPSWFPAPWLKAYGLVAPAYDATGKLVTLQARAIYSDKKPKTVWPKGYGCKNSMFANDRGRALLRGKWQANLAGVVIVEGLTDYISASVWACRKESDRRSAGTGLCEAFGVLGIYQGGINALRGIQWPAGTNVIISTDNDAQGDKYAGEIRKCLPATVCVKMRRSQ